MLKLGFILGLSLAALSAGAQEIVREGIFDGRNSSALIYKECRVEIYRGEDGVLNVAAVRDSSNAYNLWVRDGGDFRLDTKTGIKTLGRQLRFDVKDAAGVSIYDSRTTKLDRRSYNDYGTLDVVTDAEGVPTEFNFVFGRSKDGSAPYRTANTITCKHLQPR